MTQILISGASDDLIEYSIDGVEDEISEPSGTWGGVLMAPNGESLVVTARYGGGTWALGVAKTAEDGVFPAWPISFRQSQDCKYSVELVIEAPDGTALTWVS